MNFIIIIKQPNFGGINCGLPPSPALQIDDFFLKKLKLILTDRCSFFKIPLQNWQLKCHR